MQTDLTNKIAIVTGGGQGIGREIALVFADAGARIVLAARNEANIAETARIIADAGGEALPVVTDVTDETSVQAMVDAALTKYGTVDFLINNSGIAGPTANCEDVLLEEWETTMAVNVRGVFLCAKYVLPVMKRQKSGRIVNLSSITGKRPLPQRTAYATSKMAVVGFTRTLALEVGRQGITVNAISPGAVEGDRIGRVLAAVAESENISLDEARERFTECSALGKMSTERDIANMALYLCSDAGANITAQDYTICAGTTWN
jgi:NAD(P)-dependent dehydrogenase (short-subunit alcohol dehydrogenase family)